MTAQWWEMASNIVTVIGLPFALAVFIWEQRRQRQNDEEEIYQRLSDEYTTFMKLVMENADLGLLKRGGEPGRETTPMEPEQEERKQALFNILIALFERSYILVYEEKMNPQTRRLWQSWEDYMRDWCRRADFRTALDELLRGEDPAFAEHIQRIRAEEAPDSTHTPAG
ncbi:MAG: hypothetical protein ACKVZJ_00330 [Phycisphaerales bacterium]